MDFDTPLPSWLEIVSETDDTIVFQAYGQRLKLLKVWHAVYLVREWAAIWETSYLPRFSLKGKTVLDVGAGCGETAFFYFQHGVDKVIAVEPDARALECLRENAEVNKWKVDIIPEKFKLEHLKIPHDFMKMDIDGSETELYNAQIDKPCTVEVHNDVTKAEFEKRGFKKLCQVEAFVYIMGKNVEETQSQRVLDT